MHYPRQRQVWHDGLCEAHLLAHQSTCMTDSILTSHAIACVFREHESFVGGSLYIMLLNSILVRAVLQARGMCLQHLPA